MKKLLAVLAGVILVSGCYYDKADELYPSTVVQVCDTSNITFAKDVAPILQSKCATAGCHDPATKEQGYDFSGYAGAKLAIGDNKLLPCIKWEDGALPMPQGMPKLDECSINKIVRWANQGAQNN